MPGRYQTQRAGTARKVHTESKFDYLVPHIEAMDGMTEAERRGYALRLVAEMKQRRTAKPIDDLGMMYGRWHVVSAGESSGTRVVQCECGQVRTVKVGHLRNGKTQSCGCLIGDSKRAFWEQYRAEKAATRVRRAS